MPRPRAEKEPRLPFQLPEKGASRSQALVTTDRLTMAAAADAVGVPRSTFRDAIKRGRVQVDADRKVTVAELVRAGYTLKESMLLPQVIPDTQEPPPAVRSPATPPESPTPLAIEVALLRQAREALTRHCAFLERELEDAKAEKARLLTLLEAIHVPPLRPPSSAVPATAAPAAATVPRSGPPPLWEQVLEYIISSPRPRRSWQVQRALGLSKSPHRELARLARQGKLTRVAPGLYWRPGASAEGIADEATLEGDGSHQG